MPERGAAAALVDRPDAPDRSALRRLIGITTSLVGTQAATSVLGLLFWTLAARHFTIEAVGVAGAAVSLMTLLGTIGTVGLGTLLIARLPHTPQGTRRVLVRTALMVSAVVTTAICLLVPLIAIKFFHAGNLRSIAGDPANALLFAAGTALMAVTIVLDQAVLTIGNGTLQLERNVVASAAKVAALVVLALAGWRAGMTVFAAWAIGSLISLPITAWRSRGGRELESGGRLIDLSMMRGLARSAAGHHALNITLMVPLLLLPVIVAVDLSTRDNGIFTGALQVTGFVFALPYAVSVALFAASQGDSKQVIDRMRLTIPFGLGVSLLANAALFPLAPQVLSVFGAQYASQGALTLRILVLAGLPFVIKDHFVALRRVQERTGQATAVLVVFTAVELTAAYLGAESHGVLGLSIAWVATLYVEMLILAVPLVLVMFRTRRALPASPMDDTGALLPPPLLSPELARWSPPNGMPLPQYRTPSPASRYVYDRSWSDHPQSGPTGSAPSVDELILPPPPAFLSATLGGSLTGPVTAPIRILAPPQERSGRELRRAGTSATDSPRLRHRLQPQSWSPVDDAILLPIAPLSEPPAPAGDRQDAIVGPAVFLMAIGLLTIAIAVTLARSTQNYAPWPQVCFVGGLALIFVPAAVGVLLPGISSSRRVLLAVVMAVALQVSRLVLYPTRFMFHDELLHANVLRLIDTTGQLFGLNSLLPISSYYPGLEVATSAVQAITGLPAHPASVVVLLAARLVMVLAIILLVQQVTGSARVGATAAVIYAANPQMLFFNSQFSYQTVALPLAIFTIYMFVSRRRDSLLGMCAPISGAAAVVFSHHVTAGLLVLTFLVWFLVELVVRLGRGSEAGSLATMTISTAGFLAVSIANPGNTLASYLGAIAVSSGDSIGQLAGGNDTKKAFQNSAGTGPQPWEQWLIIASLILTLLVLLPALWDSRVWLRQRVSIAVLLGLTATLYPIIPGGHLTVATAEVGDRSAGFVFLGVGFVVAYWLWRGPPRRSVALGFGIGATVTFLGGVVLGAGPTIQQLPGPFQVSADARSIDGTSIAAADWMRANLSRGSVVYADRVGGLLAAAYGDQFTVRHISTGLDASRLLLDPNFTSADIALIRKAGIEYVIADRRDSYGLPNQQVYIESGEFGGQNRTQPVPLAALEKFSHVQGVNMIYDNGAVSIYDVRSLDAR